MEAPAPGQRWISQSEPELGLGIISSVEGSFIDLRFPAAGEKRRYARNGAPLRRASFQAGDTLTHARWFKALPSTPSPRKTAF